MKKGRLSSNGRWSGQGPLVVRGLGAVLMSLWPPRREDQAKSDVRSRAHIQKGGQAARRKVAPLGANSSIASEHVPDRFGQPAGDVDLGDLGAALLAEPALRLLIALAVGGMREAAWSLRERPAQVARSLFGKRAARSRLTGLAPPAGKCRCSRRACAECGSDRCRRSRRRSCRRAPSRSPGTVSASGK